METAYLHEFAKVAECGSFTAAARELHLTQSTLSKHVALLEREFGADLFVRDRSGAVIEEECVTYREEFVEQDEVVKLTTTSLTSLETELSVGAERWTLALSVDEQTRRMTVASTPASAIEVSGTGSYKENGDSWGGTPENPTPRDAVYLNYFYERENGQRCEVLDTLVFRDRGIVFEADRPTIK